MTTHMTITGPNAEGYYTLIPDDGYMLRLKSSPERLFSGAVTKIPGDFEAVEVENEE